jgi:hypothetical protein
MLIESAFLYFIEGVDKAILFVHYYLESECTSWNMNIVSLVFLFLVMIGFSIPMFDRIALTNANLSGFGFLEVIFNQIIPISAAFTLIAGILVIRAAYNYTRERRG